MAKAALDNLERRLLMAFFEQPDVFASDILTLDHEGETVPLEVLNIACTKACETLDNKSSAWLIDDMLRDVQELQGRLDSTSIFSPVATEEKL